MKRLKSIDIMRGMSMMWMLLAHTLFWWLKKEDLWVYHSTFAIFDVIGSSAFIFIAGISTIISYKNRINKSEILDDYNIKMIKNEYMLRALFMLMLALAYNIFVVIGTGDPKMIWTWFVLLTVAISLFMAWPVIKIPIIFRILVGAIIWVANQFIFAFLSPHIDELNFYGILYYFLYNTSDLEPILSFFPFFIFGTVVGEILFDLYGIEDDSERRKALKTNFLLPILIITPILIIIGVLFNFPMFLQHRTFPWMIYTIGILLLLLLILISAEEFIFVNPKKSYKFLFYFSYYSLTIFLTHNILYFLFYRQLNAINIWFYAIVTCILTGLLFRGIYKKWGPKFSIKIQLGKLAIRLAQIIYKKV